MAAKAREEETASENRQGDVEGADKVEAAPGVAAGSLSYFRAALIGQIQRFPKRRRLRQYESLKTLPEKFSR